MAGSRAISSRCPRQRCVVAAASDGRLLASASSDGSVTLVDAASGAVSGLTGLGSDPQALAFSVDGTLLAGSSSAQSGVVVWDTSTGLEQARIGASGGSTRALAWAPAAHTLVHRGLRSPGRSGVGHLGRPSDRSSDPGAGSQRHHGDGVSGRRHQSRARRRNRRWPGLVRRHRRAPHDRGRGDPGRRQGHRVHGVRRSRAARAHGRRAGGADRLGRRNSRTAREISRG